MPKQKYHVKIGGMTCTACAQTIEKALSKAQGVEALHYYKNNKTKAICEMFSQLVSRKMNIKPGKLHFKEMTREEKKS